MAGKRPAFQFYASDWLGSTKHAMMSPSQRGAYIDLLCHQHNDADCTLPDDDKALAALSGLNEGWFNGGSGLVRDCFPPAPGKPGRLANPRMLEVRADADEWSRKSREGGVKSGVSRRARAASARTSVASGSGDDRTNDEPTSNQTRTNVEPNANQRATNTPTKREPKGNPSPSSPSPSPSPPSPTSTEEERSCAKAKPKYPEAFEVWWTVYPRKIGKGNAVKAWESATKRVSQEDLLTITHRYAKSPAGNAGEFTPYPATWLNGSRYEDDPQEWEKERTNGKSHPTGPGQKFPTSSSGTEGVF